MSSLKRATLALGSLAAFMAAISFMVTSIPEKAWAAACTGYPYTTGCTLGSPVLNADLAARTAAGSGAIQYSSGGAFAAVTIGSGLSFSGGTLSATGGGSWGVIGTSTITSGTTGRLLYDNAGVLGEMSTLTAALFPALTGDVTTAGGSLATALANLAVTTAKLNTAAVTYAKIQNGASTGLLGVNNAAAPTEVAVGSGLSLSGGTLTATAGGGGTVTATSGALPVHAPIVGNGSVDIKALSALTNGQFSIGVTGADPAAGSFGRCFTNSSNVIVPAGRTAHGDSNYTILSSDCSVGTSATLTAPRVWTLPAASAFAAGATIKVYDEFGGASATNTIAVTPNGADTINGVNNATASTIGVARGGVILQTDGVSAWTVIANTFQQAYSCSAGQFASALSLTGFTTCAAAALTIASGAKALATGAIASAACTTAQTATATGTLTTDVLTASFNGDPTAVTGYVPLTAGMLTIIAYPTADTANFKVCNNTSSSITPGAITLNWRVVR